jgi:hypothetical protein
MSSLPLFETRLRLWQETFDRDRSLVELREGRLVLRATGYGCDPNVYTIVVPPAERWVVFWMKVESLGVWRWKREYVRLMLDGSSWTLDLEYEGRRLHSEGSNAWPKRFGLLAGAVRHLATGEPPRPPKAVRRRLRVHRRELAREKFNPPVVRLS